MGKRQGQERVLIIRLSALGDVAMTLPVVYSVCDAYPDVEFYMLTRPFFSKIFINAPSNLHIIKAELNKEHKGAIGLLRLIHRLKSYHFTAIADLHNILRSWLIDSAMRISGIKVKMVDKNRSSRSADNKNKIHQKSYIQRYSDVFTALGYPARITFTSLFADSTPPTKIHIHHPAVGIAPFARYANKTYPSEHMEYVVKHLCASGINVYLFGARGKEAEAIQKWEDKIDNCTSLGGKLAIADELAIMANMDLMVSMDSANQHLAAIAGAKVLSIWGSTTPACGFLAFRQSADNAMMLNLPCQPCTTAGSDKCRLGTLGCMCGISENSIITRIKSLLP